MEKIGANTVYANFYGLLSAAEAADRIEEGYVQGEGGDLQIVDPLLELWIVSGRLGLGAPLSD
jgi:hypothetical protein